MKAKTLCMLGLALAISIAPCALAKEVTGKVIAVFHEPVTVNAKTLDKVSATVLSCGTNTMETVSWSAGSLADDNSLGYLFNHLANHARSTSTKNQYMNSVMGHATFVTNDQNVVQKSTFWGYNWECGKNIEGASASAGSSSGGSTATPASTPAKGGSPFGKIKPFGR